MSDQTTIAAEPTDHQPDTSAAIDRAAAPDGREHQAFPQLTPSQIERIEPLASRETLPDNTIVFERGQRRADFLVVLSGCIEIFDFNCQGEPQVFTRHCDRQFTGEIDLFSDRKVLVSGRTAGETEVLRFSGDAFRELLAAHPDVGDICVRAFIVRRLGILEGNLGGSLLIGCHDDPATLAIRQFLRRNGYPAKTLYKDDDHARKVMDDVGLTDDDLPAFLCHGETNLKKPDLMDVAETTGLIERPDNDHCYDVAVIGAGPGGLAAAVYAASEGLSTVVLERNAPGGQAGTSSKIENYLGFPTGLSGQELAGRAQIQAQKFGATLTLPMDVVGIDGGDRDGSNHDGSPYTIRLGCSGSLRCKTIVIASGARYRKLNLDNESKYEGLGIYYAATALEAGLCEGEEVVVVGGGNSAGQAAVYLSQHTKHVHMLIRGDSLASSMSDYLVRRIDASSKITLHRHTEIVGLSGEDRLRQTRWKHNDSGEEETRDISHVFLMIGATPNSDWTDDRIKKDQRGFICTGIDMVGSEKWPLERQPNPFETSLPGIFAVGDVRSGSVKRVASAVGEGSVCVQFVHQVLTEAVD